jgi:hypothetical protein
VQVLTAGSPAGTVSAVAGAMLGPVFGSGDARSLAWERRSDLVFRELARDPATGVRLLAGRLLAAPELGPGLPPWVEQVPGYRSALTGSQLPPGFVSGFVFEGGGSADGIGIVPHRRGVLLGGVRRPGRNLLMPDGQIAAETIDRAAAAIPELASAPVLGIEVGLRPGRPQVRLEAEQASGTTVIHNYGHDGTGVFWSWGCAADVVALCGLG